jgi:putative PIN family toxin of toxin-antitoxin system
LRAVLDTNVLVSAQISPQGVPGQIYELAGARAFQLVTSWVLVSELRRVLHDKLRWDDRSVSPALRLLAQVAEFVEPVESVADIADDPSDNRVLEAALAGRADVIVSGDRHLLRLGEWRGIRILSPRAFLDEFEARP